MKHVIITGGGGFIGSHLCDAFLKRGYAVTAVDNFITGQKKNLAQALENSDFDLIVHNVNQPLPVERMRNMRHGLHGILHFACPASPVDFEKIPFDILAVDSLGTMNTVDTALKYSARYMLASTSECYGDPLVHPQRETYYGNVNTLGPRACYDETKRFAEAYVSTAMRGVGVYHGRAYLPLNGAIVRIFNTYGPRMRPDDGRIIPEFFSRAIQGKEIPIHGNGLQTRSFCYVSDLIDGIVALYESEVRDVVNLGNPDERSILEIADIVVGITESVSTLERLPARPDDPKQRCPAIEKANSLLSWRPKVNLLEGLKQTLHYFLNHAEAL